MLGQKQELGHMEREKATSVQGKSFIPYGNLANEVYAGHSFDARGNKARGTRVQVTLAAKASHEKVNTVNQTNFRTYERPNKISNSN